jgi:hypothetical protein
MRSKSKPLLAAVLAVGSLATAGAVATAGPALAVCPPNITTCAVPAPPPPPPPVTYSTSGLTERDEILTPSSGTPAVIQIGAKESFTATATASNRIVGATVALGGEDTFTCVSPNGVQVTLDYTYTPSFTASPKTVTRQPFSCPSGDVLTTGTYQLYAEAENSSGTFLGRTPTQTYQFTPEITLDNVSVPESSAGVNTGLVLVPGDTVTFTAAGQIWAGVLLTGTNGPLGWTDYDGCQSKFPLYCAPPYSLIGSLDNDGGYFYIGSGGGAAQPPYPTLSPAGVSGTRISDLYPDPPPLNLLTAPTQLILRTNDDTPGNGSGAFSVNIQVERDNQF